MAFLRIAPGRRTMVTASKYFLPPNTDVATDAAINTRKANVRRGRYKEDSTTFTGRPNSSGRDSKLQGYTPEEHADRLQRNLDAYRSDQADGTEQSKFRYALHPYLRATSKQNGAYVSSVPTLAEWYIYLKAVRAPKTP